MLRRIGAVLGGTFIGSVVNMAIIQLNMSVLHPAPPGLDPNDMAALAAYVGGLPASAFLVVMLAHLGQSFVGGWAGARLSATSPMGVALVVGALTALGGLINLLILPAPWFMWLELPLYFLTAWAAGVLELARRGRAFG